MALNQTNKLVWIVETIYKAQKITFEELNRKWMENTDLSGGEEMLKRTFHKWRWSIQDTFNLVIECEKIAPFYYYIENTEELKSGSISNWLLRTYAVSNSLLESKSIKDRILLEDIPSGREYLDPVIDAMKRNQFIHITYHNYWKNEEKEHYLMPLCIKLFRQRWYIVGRIWPAMNDTVFCLDRIRAFRLSSHTFEYPKDFDAQQFFAGCFGIITDRNCNVQDVVLKVSARQSNYMRDLPMMPGEEQQEIERTPDYSIFRLRVRPTYDFQQELLWNREELEVLEPQWLRKEVADTIERMWNKYKEDE